VLLWEGAATPPPPTETDLAAGQPAESSSVEHPALAPDKAVDDTGGTRFGSAWRDDQWWEVDLGSPKHVSRVEIDWEAAYASSYRILTSVDGTDWDAAATVSLAHAETETTSFAPRTARYLRVVGLERATQYGISFWEVSVYGEQPADPEPPVPGPEPPVPGPETPAPGPETPAPGPEPPAAELKPAAPASPPAPAAPAPPTAPVSDARPPRRTRSLRRSAARRCRIRAHRRARRHARPLARPGHRSTTRPAPRRKNSCRHA
jgi:F5/8 type C domain